MPEMSQDQSYYLQRYYNTCKATVHNLAILQEQLHQIEQMEGHWLISVSLKTFFQTQNINLNFKNKRNYMEI